MVKYIKHYVRAVATYTGWLVITPPDLVRVEEGQEFTIEVEHFRELERRGFARLVEAKPKTKRKRRVADKRLKATEDKSK